MKQIPDRKADFENDKDKKRRWIILLLILIFLLLIATGITSKFWGTIGNFLQNGGFYNIAGNIGDTLKVYNQELMFDEESVEISLNEQAPKISYTYKNIHPNDLACSTSDASLATCYVEDGYVIVRPKALGEVMVYLNANANGKTYIASVRVTIVEDKRMIELEEAGGEINLAYGNSLTFVYRLIGLLGDVKVSSSDESVAVVSDENGMVLVIGKKEGEADITLSITYQGSTYTSTYHVSIVRRENHTGPENNGGMLYPNGSTNPPGAGTTNPSTTPRPTEGVNPPTSGGDSSGGYITDIVFPGFPSCGFDKEHESYFLSVSYDTELLPISIKTEEGKENMVRYELNGSSSLTLKNGLNTLKVTSLDENGKVNASYTVTVYKPTRTVALKKFYNVLIDLSNYHLLYTVYETAYDFERQEERKEVITGDFTNDIQIQMTGNITFNPSDLYETFSGGIRIFPSKNSQLLNHSLSLKVSYPKAKSEANATVNFVAFDYQLPDMYQNGPYEIELKNNTGYKNLTFQGTNFFTGELVSTDILDASGKKIGVRIKEKRDGVLNDEVYIDITSKNGLLDLVFKESKNSSSFVVCANAWKVGSEELVVTGIAHGMTINQFSILFKIRTTYRLTLDANGGFFNELQDVYEYSVSSDDTISLGEEKYKAYKMEKGQNGECIYYRMVSYNTEKDGSGTSYPLDTVLSSFTSDMTLYAQWEKGDDSDKPKIVKRMDLPNFNLFHNEAYFQKYHRDFVIYPGASGTYVATFTNSTVNTIKITGMRMAENETICVTGGCLNMGYSVRFTPKDKKDYVYYYGGAGEKYQILNQDDASLVDGSHQITFGEGITVEPGEGVEFTLLWRWVDSKEYDFKPVMGTGNLLNYHALDTEIGNQASNLNDYYQLSVSIEFVNEENYCSFE